MKTHWFETATHDIVRVLSAQTGSPSCGGDASFLNSRLYMKGVKRDLALMTRYMSSGSILDFGCGTGVMAALCSAAGYNAHAVDIQADVSDINRQAESEADRRGRYGLLDRGRQGLGDLFGVEFRYYDGRTLPYQAQSFDGVLAYAVLEHIHDDLLESAITEISRVLKPGGMLFIFRTPRAESYSERLFPSHEKLMSEKEVATRLTQAGFHVLAASRTDFFPQFAPGRLQGVMNATSGLLFAVQNLLDRLPTGYICHDMRIVARKGLVSGGNTAEPKGRL